MVFAQWSKKKNIDITRGTKRHGNSFWFNGGTTDHHDVCDETAWWYLLKCHFSTASMVSNKQYCMYIDFNICISSIIHKIFSSIWWIIAVNSTFMSSKRIWTDLFLQLELKKVISNGWLGGLGWPIWIFRDRVSSMVTTM